MVNFRKAAERNVAQEVTIMKINPTMDIVALALESGEISLHRLLNWQRVWQIPKIKKSPEITVEEKLKVLNLEWSPNGKVLAVAYNVIPDSSTYPQVASTSYHCPIVGHLQQDSWKSSYFLYDIDTNSVVFHSKVDFEIECFCWQERGQVLKQDSKIPHSVNIEQFTLPLDTVNIPYVDLFSDDCDGDSIGSLSSKMFGSELAEKTLKERAYVGKLNSGTLAEEFAKYDLLNVTANKSLDVLLIGGQNGILDVYAFGIHRIFTLDLNDLIKRKFPNITDSSYKLAKLWISQDLKIVSILLKVDTSLFLYSFECKFLSNNWTEVFVLSKIKTYIDICSLYLKDTANMMISMWDDLISEVDSKLSNYIDQGEKPKESTTSGDVFRLRAIKSKLKPEEFIEMLVFGEISLNLEKFLTDINSRGLRKLSQSIETCFMEINRININQIQRALFQLFSHLYVLRGITLNDERFGNLCLEMSDLHQLIRNTKSALNKTIGIQSSISDSIKKIRAFIRWLQKCIEMVSGIESNGRDVADPFINTGANLPDIPNANIALSNQDLHLIIEFLRENSITNGFKFENVAKILRSNVTEDLVKCCCSVKVNHDEQNTLLYEKLREQFFNNKLFQAELQKMPSNNIDSVNDSLLRKFLPQIESDNISVVDRDPANSEDVANWAQDLFSVEDDIDSYCSKLYAHVSLPQQLEMIRSNSVIYFNRMCRRITLTHHKLIEQSALKAGSDYVNYINSVLFPVASIIKLENESTWNRIDCHFSGKEATASKITDDYQYVMFASNSLLTIARFQLNPTDLVMVEMIRLLFVTKCISDCKCEQLILFDINDCEFYNGEHLMVLFEEKHFDFEILTDSIAVHMEDPIKVYLMEDEEPEMEEIELTTEEECPPPTADLSSKQHQYLAQVNYLQLFKSERVTKYQVPNFFDSNSLEELSTHLQAISGSAESISVDLSTKVSEVRNSNNSSSDSMETDSKFAPPPPPPTDDNCPVVLRYLADSKLATIAVSGSRRLACCASGNKLHIVTYELDVSEDEDEEEEEEAVEDEATPVPDNMIDVEVIQQQYCEQFEFITEDPGELEASACCSTNQHVDI